MKGIIVDDKLRLAIHQLGQPEVWPHFEYLLNDTIKGIDSTWHLKADSDLPKLASRKQALKDLLLQVTPKRQSQGDSDE